MFKFKELSRFSTYFFPGYFQVLEHNYPRYFPISGKCGNPRTPQLVLQFCSTDYRFQSISLLIIQPISHTVTAFRAHEEWISKELIIVSVKSCFLIVRNISIPEQFYQSQSLLISEQPCCQVLSALYQAPSDEQGGSSGKSLGQMGCELGELEAHHCLTSQWWSC